MCDWLDEEILNSKNKKENSYHEDCKRYILAQITGYCKNNERVLPLNIPGIENNKDKIQAINILDDIIDRIEVKCSSDKEGESDHIKTSLKSLSPSYYACLRLRYFLVRFNINKLEENDKDRANRLWNSMIPWLNTCTNVTSGLNYFFEYYHLDREGEIKRVLYDINNRDTGEFNEKGNILDYMPDKKDKADILSTLVHEWFLPRYDLETANKIVKVVETVKHEINNKENESEKIKSFWLYRRWKPSFNEKISCIAIVIILCICAVFLGTLFRQDNFHLIILSEVSFIKEQCQIMLSEWLKIPFSLLFILSLYIITICMTCKRNIRAILLPRMMGGITVGYLFLISSDRMVSFVLEADILRIISISILSIFISYVFLKFEVKRQLRKDTKKIFDRTKAVLSLGLIESTIIGLIILELFSKIFSGFLLNPLNNTVDPLSFKGPLASTLYIKVIILFIPLALLVGIILQLFWEEKPISKL